MVKLTLDDIKPLLGLPWVRGANGPDEFDCWGLVKWCLDEIGISHSVNVDYSFPNGIEEEFSKSLGSWVKIDSPENNCIAYGYKGSLPCHIGFVIDGFIFHSVGDINSPGYVAITKISNFKRLYREVRFYKWQL